MACATLTAWPGMCPRVQGVKRSLLAFVIGSNVGSPVRYETINIVRRGANFGYPLREGPEFKPESPIYGPLSADNTLPLRISDTVTLDQRVPMQDSALAYRTGVEGLAIANGFVYRGKRWPQLQGAVVFGDITSGRLFYARMADLIAATDGNPKTLAAYSEITTTLPTLVQERIRVNPPAPGFGAGPSGWTRGAAAAGPTDACDLRRRLHTDLGVQVDLGLRPQVRPLLPGHCGSNCASQQMRPERSTS